MGIQATQSAVEAVPHSGRRSDEVAVAAMKASVTFWFLVTAAGQWLFVYFIGAFYGSRTLSGDFAAWNDNRLLKHGHVDGDMAGNIAFAAHVLMAALITAGGTLQLVPRLRARAPRFHRWNGRVYAATAVAISLGGLYLVLTRGPLAAPSDFGVVLNALLILGFAAVAVQRARERDLGAHRRWALRLFLAVNGVWMFRVMLMFWIVANGGALVGIGEDFDGPAILVIAYASYLLPLGILQVYFAVQRRAVPTPKLVLAGALFVATLAMGVGIAGAFGYLWRPLL